MKVSAVLSIHNRSKLFHRALDSYVWQTMDPKDWEIILVDDGSTENLEETYRHLRGKINLVHVRMDHTRHPIFRKMNPDWEPGKDKNWFHTPAISINLGTSVAHGKVICLCHPEILHAPTNFERAWNVLQNQKLFIFGRTYIGTPQLNRHLSVMHEAGYSWADVGWEDFYGAFLAKGPEWHSHVLDETQLYWYTSFLPKSAIEAVRGVDFAYLAGVAAEDDDFRQRVYGAGWEPVHRRDIVGIHQYHEDEKEKHRDRNSDRWKAGLETNRAIYRDRQTRGFPRTVNDLYDWTGRETLSSLKGFYVS